MEKSFYTAECRRYETEEISHATGGVLREANGGNRTHGQAKNHGRIAIVCARLNCIYVHCHDDAPNPQLSGRLAEN